MVAGTFLEGTAAPAEHPAAEEVTRAVPVRELIRRARRRLSSSGSGTAQEEVRMGGDCSRTDRRPGAAAEASFRYADEDPFSLRSAVR